MQRGYSSIALIYLMAAGKRDRRAIAAETCLTGPQCLIQPSVLFMGKCHGLIALQKPSRRVVLRDAKL